MLQPYDIVVIKAEYEDAEVASQRGHIIDMVEGDEIAVFVYEFEHVWCMKASDVSATTLPRTHAARRSASAARANYPIDLAR